MQRTILLTHHELGPKISKFLFFMIGISQSVQGIRHLIDTPLTTGDILFGGFLLLIGVILIFLGFTLFSHTASLSPKITVDEERIIAREKIFSRVKRIDWKDIKEITFKSYELDILQSSNHTQVIILRTTPDVSIEVKKLVREMADKKMITVNGG